MIILIKTQSNIFFPGMKSGPPALAGPALGAQFLDPWLDAAF